MQIKDIYNFLDSISPFSLQEKWDNSGLILGNLEDSFSEVYISLDLDLEFLNTIPTNSLIITHHPLFYLPYKA